MHARGADEGGRILLNVYRVLIMCQPLSHAFPTHFSFGFNNSNCECWGSELKQGFLVPAYSGRQMGMVGTVGHIPSRGSHEVFQSLCWVHCRGVRGPFCSERKSHF